MTSVASFRDRYAAYNGTAPVEFSSGGRVVHRVSERGNRTLNHALHLAVMCQLRQPHSEGRAYFDRRVAEGKTNKEAIRALKRQISNNVYRHLITDARTQPRRVREDTRKRLISRRDRLRLLQAGSSVKSLPAPQRATTTPTHDDAARPPTPP